MTRLSVVIPAPKGASSCLPLNLAGAGVDDAELEIIVVTGPATNMNANVPSGIQIIETQTMDVLELRRLGILQARADWVVITEDHCRPLTGYLEAYRRAIEDNPNADMIYGAVVNDTSTAYTGTANFLFGYYDQWIATPANPPHPSIANLAVRKSAILPEELQVEAGFEARTLVRLIGTGKTAFLPAAIVDHISDEALLLCCLYNFHNARACIGLLYRIDGGSRLRHFRHIVEHCARIAFLRPVIILKAVSGRHLNYWQIAPRVLAIAFSHTLGAIAGYLTGGGESAAKIDHYHKAFTAQPR